jgi:hypothetical protein
VLPKVPLPATTQKYLQRQGDPKKQGKPTRNGRLNGYKRN